MFVTPMEKRERENLPAEIDLIASSRSPFYFIVRPSVFFDPVLIHFLARFLWTAEVKR